MFARAWQAEGHHPLIFSQWTSVLDILEWLLGQLKLPFLRLDGSTAVADRLALVDQLVHTVHHPVPPLSVPTICLMSCYSYSVHALLVFL